MARNESGRSCLGTILVLVVVVVVVIVVVGWLLRLTTDESSGAADGVRVLPGVVRASAGS